jgi:hypothetical protein
MAWRNGRVQSLYCITYVIEKSFRPTVDLNFVYNGSHFEEEEIEQIA